MPDYHNRHGFQFTEDHVLAWVSQFDANDQRFILEEFIHLLKQGIYISEGNARELLLLAMKDLAKRARFKDVKDFLDNVEFLRLQKEVGNSQSEILDILDEVLKKECGLKTFNCGEKSKKYVLYIDDIFATGNTAFQDLKKWLQQKSESGNTNLEEVVKGNKIPIISVFCLHTWPTANIGFRFKMDKAIGTDLTDKIKYRYDYKVENHPTNPNQRFNFAYPIKRDDKNVIEYLRKLGEDSPWPMTKIKYAMREPMRPKEETFFSSPENRIRFEDILLLKGIEIFEGVQKLERNQRPMGNINPTFQTLGTGTLFFAWRNISNTTPIVFWWESKSKIPWFPLFPVVNRG